ncbi:MAG: T9SS type A sorting domain-containing protein [Bacteroidetes bacterium]|nr:MAG: T9SS type A sorting domain-containing protein [Bacteroidota bacterium]
MRKIFSFFYVSIIILSCIEINAQSFDKTSLPAKLGSSHFGTDFWMTFNPNWETAGIENTIRIFVTSFVETSVKIEIPGKGYQAQMNTIPFNPIQFDIPIAIGQPFMSGVTSPSPEEQVYNGAGIHVTSKDPIVVYGLARGFGSSDAYMALPTMTWGREYIIASWIDVANNTDLFLPGYISVIAAYDNTKVYFTLGGNSGTKTSGGLLPGQSEQFTMYKGDVLVIPSLGRYSDLSGSRVTSNKPIGVISGHRCATVPESVHPWCDYLAEMEMPTELWGKEFHIGPIVKRKKNPVIKIIPKEPGTKIYKNGIEITSIKYAGGLENDGWLRMRTDNGSPKVVFISSDKPVSVTLFNQSRTEDTINIDPFSIIQIPLEQYQKEIFFTTPSTKNSLEFPTNLVSIIYESIDGNTPDDMEIGKEVNGSFEWTKIRVTSPTTGDPFGTASNGKKYFFKSYSLSNIGTYKIRANTPIMVYSYGYSNEASYGYPASAELVNLEKNLDTLGPIPTYSVECDGSVVNASVEDMPKNDDRSNLSIVCFHNHYSYNYDFNYNEFVPGERNKTNWNLSVKDLSKDARAVITFGDRTGHDTTVEINYFVRKPEFSQESFDLGLVRIGNTETSELRLYNKSPSSELNLNNIFLKCNDKGFELLNDNEDVINFPLVIPPLDSFKMKVKFTGTQQGYFSDSIGISDDCNTWMLGYVQAEAGIPKISVTDFNFPDTRKETKSSGQIQIRNDGNYDLVIKGNKLPTDSAFKIDIQEISTSKPIIIKPNQIFTFEAMFQPTEVRDYIDSVVFISDANSETDPTAVLTGKGLEAKGVNDAELENNMLSVFPNPADNKLVIRADNSIRPASVKIFDAYGNEISERTFEYGNPSMLLDVSGLSNGIYYMVLNSGKGFFKSSFIVIR